MHGQRQEDVFRWWFLWPEPERCRPQLSQRARSRQRICSWRSRLREGFL